MKKKIISICFVVALAATAIIGGTLAYFTDSDTETNKFTYGNVEIDLIEKNADGSDFTQGQKLLPGSKTENEIGKQVTVQNLGSEDAYMWIEVWIPSELDDGDDNSPKAPGLGNSLHFNYPEGVTETKATYLGSKDIDGVSYNGYVHYIAGATSGIIMGESTSNLLDQVYMDKDVTQCEEEHEDCLVLMDGSNHYSGSWDLVINAVGFQSAGVATIEDAIEEWYGKSLDGHIW